jgi:hypothetical protein
MIEPEDFLPVDQVGRRTCLGCGGKKSKRSLLRFVAIAGVLVADEKLRLPGRGVYCCRTASCLSKFVGRKRRISAGLRHELSDYRALSVLLERFVDRPGELGPGD